MLHAYTISISDARRMAVGIRLDRVSIVCLVEVKAEMKYRHEMITHGGRAVQ